MVSETIMNDSGTRWRGAVLGAVLVVTRARERRAAVVSQSVRCTQQPRSMLESEKSVVEDSSVLVQVVNSAERQT